MLTIGEFSNICKVSTKTLRYYAEIGLLLPDRINPDNGYRYYSIGQLETMLLISRLKTYQFSLEDIKALLESNDVRDEQLGLALTRKKKEIEKQVQEFTRTLDQLNLDLSNLEQNKSILSFMESIDVRLVEVPVMQLLSIRKMVHESEFAAEYGSCFHTLFRRMTDGRFTMLAPPMVLFHSSEFSPFGLEVEFAIPVKEEAPDTRDFHPGLCLKAVLHGSYSNLPSVYAKQCEWAEKEGYESSDALYEVYVTDPSQVSSDQELITEVYYPVKKKAAIDKKRGK